LRRVQIWAYVWAVKGRSKSLRIIASPSGKKTQFPRNFAPQNVRCRAAPPRQRTFIRTSFCVIWIRTHGSCNSQPRVNTQRPCSRELVFGLFVFRDSHVAGSHFL
jgi:hypothetical protein